MEDDLQKNGRQPKRNERQPKKMEDNLKKRKTTSKKWKWKTTSSTIIKKIIVNNSLPDYTLFDVVCVCAQHSIAQDIQASNRLNTLNVQT
jgi:hypothetical protein